MTALKTGTWILVAEADKALFLENIGDAEVPIFEVRRKDEHDNPPTRAQGAHAPGRMPDTGTGQRSALADTDWHRLEKTRFAEELGDLLYQMAHRGRFERLVVLAGPKLLGDLRDAYHPEVSARILAEIPKSVADEPIDRLEQRVKEELADPDRPDSFETALRRR